MKNTSVSKMSKKAQRDYYSRQRNSWGGLFPVTRKPAKPGAYNRASAKAKDRKEMEVRKYE